MATGANTYGTVAGVERLIGDIVTSRTFGSGTVPTLTQAEAELDNVAAEINAELDVYGYTVPISSANYATAYAAAKAANEYGAAARLLGTIPAEAYNSDEDIEGTSPSRSEMYERLLTRFLKRIKEGRLRAGMREGRLSNTYSGSRLDDDSEVKVPFFTRDMDMYPGSRSLTE